MVVNVGGVADGDDDSRLMLKSLRSEGERLFLIKKKGWVSILKKTKKN